MVKIMTTLDNYALSFLVCTGLVLVAVTGCQRTPAATETKVSGQVMSAKDAIDGQRKTETRPTVLDVRTSEEFANGHIAGARNISVAASDFEAQIATLDRDTTYLVHCAVNSPKGRADRAIAVMEKLDFRRIQSLSGGFRAWAAAGGAVERGSRRR